MLDYLKNDNSPIKYKEPTMTLNIANNICLSENAIKNLNVDAMSDQDIYQLCLKNCSKILDNISSDPDTIRRLLLNSKFIINLSQALYSVALTEEEKKQLCNAIYVLRLKESNASSSVKILLLNMAKIINRNIMPRIIDLGFSEDVAGEIVLARYSSKASMKQVKRINKVFISLPIELSASVIAKVYEILGYFSHFTDLFEGIMYDKLNQKILNSLSQEQRENYATINIALIEIMEQIPFNLCYTLLLNFIDTRLMRSEYDLRFNLNSCSVDDYPRINAAIDALTKIGKTVPSY